MVYIVAFLKMWILPNENAFKVFCTATYKKEIVISRNYFINFSYIKKECTKKTKFF